MFRALSMAVLTAALVVGTGTVAQAQARPVRPLDQAHAHNDYEHERPLHDALAQGFTSVEADIYLVDGELRVGHDPEDLVPGRTLESLYLDPLAQRVRTNRGTVYRGHREPLQLLVDIKNPAPNASPRR